MSLQPGVLGDTGQAQPCPASPPGLSWDRGRASGTGWGTCEGALGCTHLERAQGSILQHLLLLQLQQPGRKGTFERSQGGEQGGAPLHAQTIPLSTVTQACSSWKYSGSSQQWVRISPGCSAHTKRAQLSWAPWGHAWPDPGCCMRTVLCVPLKGAKFP